MKETASNILLDYAKLSHKNISKVYEYNISLIHYRILEICIVIVKLSQKSNNICKNKIIFNIIEYYSK